VQVLKGIKPSDVDTGALGRAMAQQLAQLGIVADVTAVATLAAATRRHLAQTSQLSTVWRLPPPSACFPTRRLAPCSSSHQLTRLAHATLLRGPAGLLRPWWPSCCRR
jgi:hypothetical protein